MIDQRDSSTVTGVFSPTWRRALFAFVLAALGFCLPQEVPLVWYPLNEPGTDINYLEITCAANITSETQLYLDYGQGFTELDSIRIPISPTKQAFTYTFPLQDAPLIGLRVDPYKATGELSVTNLRIINRRDEEIRRFNREDFALTNQMSSISPTPDGWKFVTVAAAWDPYSIAQMPAPLIPVGMNHRNLLRCLLSTGYLAGMLLILLLAVLFTFYRPSNWPDFLKHLGFMACIGLLFSTVGNRGLIKNSVHYARYRPPAIAPGLSLELDVQTEKPTTAQLFWDIGNGFNESESIRQPYESHNGLQTIHFPLPSGKILKGLRYDPRENEGTLDIKRIRVVDAGKRSRLILPLDSIREVREIAEFKMIEGQIHLRTSSHSTDSITVFSAQAVSAINKVLSQSEPAAY